jgi:hypothetical protein
MRKDENEKPNVVPWQPRAEETPKKPRCKGIPETGGNGRNAVRDNQPKKAHGGPGANRQPPHPRPAIQDAPRSPHLSDDALALRFADLHADDRRYVAFGARWMRWNGVHWEQDRTLDTFDAARVICREAAAGSKKNKAVSIASARTIAAVEKIARSDKRLATTIERFDVGQDVFGTPEDKP